MDMQMIRWKAPPWQPVAELKTGISLGIRPLGHLDQVSRADPPSERRPDLLRSKFHVSVCGKDGLVQRQFQPDPGEKSLGDALDARLGQGDFPEEHGLGLSQLFSRHQRTLHIFEIPLDDSTRRGYIGGIATVVYFIDTPRSAHIER